MSLKGCFFQRFGLQLSLKLQRSLLIFFFSTLSFSSVASAQNVQESIFAVQFDGRDLGIGYFLQDDQNRLWAREDDLNVWGILLDHYQGSPLSHNNQNYYLLEDFPGVESSVDPQTLTVNISTEEKIFAAGAYDVGEDESMELPPITKVEPGGFFNYDNTVLYDTNEDQVSFSSILEQGAYSQYGVAVNSLLLDELGTDSNVARLDTSYIYDAHDDMFTLVFWDAISRPGDWSGSVRYGGVQWATNFATQPGFVTYPLPTLRGEAAVPTTVDLLIDNAIRSQQNLNAGPFELNNLPTVSGSGEIQLVTRDLLGREEVITVPYFTHQALLDPSVADYTIDVGFTREDYGEKSFSYSRFLTAGTYRRGLSDTVTGEWHGEFLLDQQSTGLSATYLLGKLGFFRTSVAGSRSTDLGTGGLVGLGWDHQLGPVSFGVSGQATTEQMTYLGLQPGQPAPAYQATAFGATSLGDYGQLGVSYIFVQNRDVDEFNNTEDIDNSDDFDETDTLLTEEVVEFVTTNYSVNITSNLYFDASALYEINQSDGYSFFVFLNWVIDDTKSAGLGGTFDSSTQEGFVDFAQEIPGEVGVGYQVTLGAGTEYTADGIVATQTHYGLYSLEASYFDDSAQVRGNMDGGMTLTRAGIHFSQPLHDSFAVVRIPGYPDTEIQESGYSYGYTNQDGELLMPNLASYQELQVNVNPSALPFDAQIDDASRVMRLPYRSGVVLDFEVTKGHLATVRLSLPNGDPVPLGAKVSIPNTQKEFFVGREGEAFIQGVNPGENTLHVHWQGKECQVTVTYQAASEQVTNLGSAVCQ